MNNDLISRSALLDDVRQTIEASGCVNHEGEMLDCIRYAPAVDAVEVVRCGLCKHWDKEGLYCHHPAGLSFCGKTGAAKGFCCFGERRADNAD